MQKTDSQTVIEPSPIIAVLWKILTATVCGFLFLLLSSYFPINNLKDSRFLEETAIPYKFLYLYCTLMTVRIKYYFAWVLADAICNNSGLGFNGYTDDGQEKWDGASNVDIFKFEVSFEFSMFAVGKLILGKLKMMEGIQ